MVQAAPTANISATSLVTFDDNGVVKAAKGDPILVDSSVKPDEAVAARIKELAKPHRRVAIESDCKTEAPIDGSRETCRAKECEMGSLVADANARSRQGPGRDGRHHQRRRLARFDRRRRRDDGRSHHRPALPETLSTFQLKGSDIRAALKTASARSKKAAALSRRSRASNIRFDRSKPAGSRLVSVEVKEGDAFAALDPEKTYSLVSNNFMRDGGDGYAVFKDKGENPMTTVRASKRCSPTTSPPTSPSSPTPTAASRKWLPQPGGRAQRCAGAGSRRTGAGGRHTGAGGRRKAGGKRSGHHAPGFRPPAAAAAEGPRKPVIARAIAVGPGGILLRQRHRMEKNIAANGDPAPRALEIGRELDIRPSKTICLDIGTGAGFPAPVFLLRRL